MRLELLGDEVGRSSGVPSSLEGMGGSRASPFIRRDGWILSNKRLPLTPSPRLASLTLEVGKESSFMKIGDQQYVLTLTREAALRILRHQLGDAFSYSKGLLLSPEESFLLNGLSKLGPSPNAISCIAFPEAEPPLLPFLLELLKRCHPGVLRSTLFILPSNSGGERGLFEAFCKLSLYLGLQNSANTEVLLLVDGDRLGTLPLYRRGYKLGQEGVAAFLGLHLLTTIPDLLKLPTRNSVALFVPLINLGIRYTLKCEEDLLDLLHLAEGQMLLDCRVEEAIGAYLLLETPISSTITSEELMRSFRRWVKAKAPAVLDLRASMIPSQGEEVSLVVFLALPSLGFLKELRTAYESFRPNMTSLRREYLGLEPWDLRRIEEALAPYLPE